MVSRRSRAVDVKKCTKKQFFSTFLDVVVVLVHVVAYSWAPYFHFLTILPVNLTHSSLCLAFQAFNLQDLLQ